MTRRGLAWTLAIVLVLGGAGYGVWRAYEWVAGQLVDERCWVVLEGTDTLSLSHEQARNSAIIVAASYQHGLSEQAAVIALATAWQESGLRNLNYGDRDSLGLFQQRPSYGWGTEEEIMDPWYSSGRFYEELVKFPDWETTDVNDIAQKVQRSGHPEAYRQHETNARALAGALRGTRPGTLGCTTRSTNPGDPAAFEEVVAQVPGIEMSVDGATVRLTADDETALWSAAQLAVANTRDAGVLRTTVGDVSWNATGRARSWERVSSPEPSGSAVIQLRD